MHRKGAKPMINLSSYEYKGFDLVQGNNQIAVEIDGKCFVYRSLGEAMQAIDTYLAIDAFQLARD
jgi:hypothetical protein